MAGKNNCLCLLCAYILPKMGDAERPKNIAMLIAIYNRLNIKNMLELFAFACIFDVW